MTESVWLKSVVTETIERAKNTPDWMNSEVIACRQQREPVEPLPQTASPNDLPESEEDE